MPVHGTEHGGAEEPKNDDLVRSVYRVEQVLTRIRGHRPVVVLARAVDAGERLLVYQADETVLAGNLPKRQHDKLLMVGRDVGVFKDRRDLVLTGRDLVMARFDGHAEAVQLPLDLQHVGQHAVGDAAEVMIAQLLSSRRLRSYQRAPAYFEIRTAVVELLIHQKILLLGADGYVYALCDVIAEEAEHAQRLLLKRIQRPKQRDLMVKRLARPRCKTRRDGQVLAVLVLDDERRRRRVPRRIPARFKRHSQATRGEARCVRLALNQVAAGELHNCPAAFVGRDEGVVLLGRVPCERLEPVRKMRRTFIDGPPFHGHRNGIGNRHVERTPLFDRREQAADDILWPPPLQLSEAEGVLTKDALDVHLLESVFRCPVDLGGGEKAVLRLHVAVHRRMWVEPKNRRQVPPWRVTGSTGTVSDSLT